jgi:hypothetical protein
LHRRGSLAVLTAALAGYDIGDDDRIDALRVLAPACTASPPLQDAGGFGWPREIDATYSRYIQTLDAGLRSRQPSK